MKNWALFLTIGASLVLPKAFADTDDADATIEVLAAISITTQSNLDFGQVFAGDAGGTLAPGDAGAAEFLVEGAPSETYLVTLPAAPIQMDHPVEADQIEVSNFVHNATQVLDGVGEELFNVGADYAAIPGTHAAGIYTGSFTVEVAYD